MLELFFQEIIFNLVENNFFLIPGWIESTNFIMNTYVNVAFLRLLLSAEQLAKSDQHLEEELMFCAQANPLSQWGTYLPWINLLLHTSVWFTYVRLDVGLDLGDLLYGPQLLLRERDQVTPIGAQPEKFNFVVEFWAFQVLYTCQVLLTFRYFVPPGPLTYFLR